MKNKKTKFEKKNYETLFFFCLALLFGYSGKYFIAYEFYDSKEFNNNTTNETIYNNTNDINMMNNHIFYLNNSIFNDTIYNYDLNQKIYSNICLIYILLILLSVILLYSMFV